MEISKQLKWFLWASPIFVLAFTRICIELSIELFQSEISWIPAFIAYYISIAVIIIIAVRFFHLPLANKISFSLIPVPKIKLLFLGIIIPALLPIAAFITQSKFVPPIFFLYIIIFSIINSIFEEGYWRGLLTFLPVSNAMRTLFSATLFSFSHFLFWEYWYKTPMVMIPTVISTFIMGVLYMWFMNKKKNLLYPILSHIIVDILNLSVAVYAGIVTPDKF